ncbi:hypothetical protein [Alloactinosynnema sp. L-07]|nr:hypothetical protein [Alloactinosynnema sp. L-07]
MRPAPITRLAIADHLANASVRALRQVPPSHTRSAYAAYASTDNGSTTAR